MNILCLSAKKQMIHADACGVVAAMTHIQAVGDLAMSQLPRHTVRLITHAATVRDLTVAVIDFTDP